SPASRGKVAMRRREFIGGLGSFAISATASRAQQSPRLPVVRVLWHAGNAEEEREYFSVLGEAFAQLGYVEGKNIAFQHKFPAEDPARFRSLAKELVDSKTDVIVAVTSAGAMALKEIPTTIPVVFIIDPDP